VPSKPPAARWMARSMFSLGMLAARARSMAAAKAGFVSGLGSCRAQTMISRVSLEKRFERFLSCFSLRYLMLAHLE